MADEKKYAKIDEMMAAQNTRWLALYGTAKEVVLENKECCICGVRTYGPAKFTTFYMARYGWTSGDIDMPPRAIAHIACATMMAYNMIAALQP